MTTRTTATEVQCKRCGSSMSFEPCEHCLDGFDGHECGEDTCSCADPQDNRACGVCGGEGGSYSCLSSPEWCEANPRPGCESVERHTPEWFCWHGVLAEDPCKRCEEGDVA
jgi:hypothetical protein